ncbi:MAG: response regulator [Magnetococcales bacterium]|nr:response regulator [Magnetococcales bacterium]NGZ27300.1 response regulator [Magnetococcales bacterium]
MKILIADDDFFTRISLKSTLEQFGRCDMVTNGVEALEIFIDAYESGNAYRLVILDIQMPGMDGVEALKNIRQYEKDSKIPPKEEATIFMVTALDTPSTIVRTFMDGGCTDYIIKTNALLQLPEKVKEHGLV